jgi:hypothetical protein
VVDEQWYSSSSSSSSTAATSCHLSDIMPSPHRVDPLACRPVCVHLASKICSCWLHTAACMPAPATVTGKVNLAWTCP